MLYYIKLEEIQKRSTYKFTNKNDESEILSSVTNVHNKQQFKK